MSWYPFTLGDPETEPVTLDEAKEQCRVLDDEADAQLALLIKAAREHVESYCGQSFSGREVELKCDAFYDLSRLPRDCQDFRVRPGG